MSTVLLLLLTIACHFVVLNFHGKTAVWFLRGSKSSLLNVVSVSGRSSGTHRHPGFKAMQDFEAFKFTFPKVIGFCVFTKTSVYPP